MTKFLVTGSAGLIGSQVVRDLSNQKYEVYSCYNNSKPKIGILTRLDVTNPNKIKQVLDEIRPNFIIHLAAITNVDLCETEPEMTMKINAEATQLLVHQAAKHDSFFLYVSTDYVFDGAKGMRKESDPVNPLGFYGKSKLEGEKFVQNSSSNWCIARTSTPFGIHHVKKSFPLWVIENLKLENELKIVTDQFTSPTFVPNLSRMLVEISEKKINGIIHTAGASRISRYELAKLIADKLGLDSGLLKPILMSEINWKAPRPLDSSLDVSKATSILLNKPQTIQESMDLFLHELQANDPIL